MRQPLELLVETKNDTLFLLSPGVGTFTCSLPPGLLLGPGQSAGSLTTLGVARELVVPATCSGKIVGSRPERVHAPVAYRTRLYELKAIGEGISFAVTQADDESSSDLVVRSTHAGRFWHRPSPADEAFANVGDIIEDGAPVGLIEVMKTFTHVHYRAKGGLPARAKIVRFLVDDGAESENGAALLEVEPA